MQNAGNIIVVWYIRIVLLHNSCPVSFPWRLKGGTLSLRDHPGTQTHTLADLVAIPGMKMHTINKKYKDL